MQTIEHVVKLHGRQVCSIEPPVIVSNNQQIDILSFDTDKLWAGYDEYSIVFHRAHVEDVELLFTPCGVPKMTVPASHIQEKGWLSFTVKAIKSATDDEPAKRLVTASKGARIEVVPSGVFEGGEPTEEQLTAIEQATLDAETAATAANNAAINANDAAAQVDEALDDIADALETAQEASRVANEAELTRLEQAIADIGDMSEYVEAADEAATRATEAAERAERIASLDYEAATNKPSINDVTLIGDKTLQELGMTRASNRAVIELF